MRIGLTATLLLVFAWLLAACSNLPIGYEPGEQRSAGSSYADGLLSEGRTLSGDRSARAADSSEVEAVDSTTAVPRSDPRKIVYTAQYRLRTSNLEVALTRAKDLARSMGGWVHEESSGRFIFRVPADKFWHTIAKIPEIGRVVSHSIKSKDVTEEFMDLGLRLKLRQKFLAELQDLYAKGGSLKDLLAVKKEIDRVTEEVERIEARIRFLSEQIAWSTIHLTFQVQSESVSRDFNLPFAWLKSLGIQNLLRSR
jgi:Domain of unknown function (DUF4349)